MDFPKISCIYCIECKINNKKYIGQTIDLASRFYNHNEHFKNSIHFNRLLEKDVREYGKSNFKFYILKFCKEQDLDKNEIFYIKKYNTFKDRTKGYNLDSGGKGAIEKEANSAEIKNKKRNIEINKIILMLNSYEGKSLNKVEQTFFVEELFKSYLIRQVAGKGRSDGLLGINNALNNLKINYIITSSRKRIRNRQRETFWEIIKRDSQND